MADWRRRNKASVFSAFAGAAAAAGLPAFGGAAGTMPVDLSSEISAGSDLGQTMLSVARRLEQQGDGDGIDFDWVSGYSIKFQGCHHAYRWYGDEEDGGGGEEGRPKIRANRLVRFRLCPTDVCTYEDSGGCGSGYGDYVIDMGAFVQAYWEYKLGREERMCEYYYDYICGCQNDYCLYDCYMYHDMDYCVDENPYVDDDYAEEKFQVDNYLECAEWEFPNQRRRKLEDEGDDDNDDLDDDDYVDNDEDEARYFIGPYCSDEGGKIYLGVFTDGYCTNFAGDEDNGYSHTDFYYNLVGEALPYSSKTLVAVNCISCKEPENPAERNDDDNYDDDVQDEDEVVEMCEQLYQRSGKCESSLSGVIDYPNENACNYIEGIRTVRRDGTVVQDARSGSTIFSVLIAVFCVSSVLLGVYVYYLKTQSDRRKVKLSAQ